MIWIRLYYEFFKAGLFAVGGGLATLPFLQDMGQATGWFGQQELLDLIAVSESTPGPIGVNAATYVGYHVGGLAGGIVATVGLISPSVLVILLISKVLEQFKESALVKALFYGLRPASTGLIAAAGFSVALATFARIASLPTEPLFALRWPEILLAALLWLAIKKWDRHPVVYLAASAAVGIAAGYSGFF